MLLILKRRGQQNDIKQQNVIKHYQTLFKTSLKRFRNIFIIFTYLKNILKIVIKAFSKRFLMMFCIMAQNVV